MYYVGWGSELRRPTTTTHVQTVTQSQTIFVSAAPLSNSYSSSKSKSLLDMYLDMDSGYILEEQIQCTYLSIRLNARQSSCMSRLLSCQSTPHLCPTGVKIDIAEIQFTKNTESEKYMSQKPQKSLTQQHMFSHFLGFYILFTTRVNFVLL